MDRTTLFIVDDHDVVRYGLRAVVEADGDIEVIGEAGTGEAALEALAEKQPDIVLLDLRMPGMGGVETCRLIHERYPEVRVVILTSYEDDDELFAVLSAGASGYLMKDMSPESLVQSIRGVSDGQTVLHAGVAQRVIEGRNGVGAASEKPSLSVREADVLALMARGFNNRRIAQELWISEPTVKSHVSHILHKLGATDRTGAVVEAIRQGLVHVENGNGNGE